MITYIGLDGEMSSSDIENGGKLIQIGLAKFENGNMTSTSVLLNPGQMDWTEEAESVHQFTRNEIEMYGVIPDVVDQDLADWVNTGSMRRDTVMVGFNVGSFDRPFVKQALPILFSRFSRRSVDLNSIIFSMSNSDREFNKIKKNAKTYAIQQMDGMFSGFKNRQHDAEYDAVMALFCFEYLRSIMNVTNL